MKLVREDYSLCEWLIRTFTNENMCILDNCMGSGTTGIATLNVGEGRRFIEDNERKPHPQRSRVGMNFDFIE